ncbi:histidine phosphatase family protein [Paenibacillus rubinfantis]|uniref:hypothetical protein n=1 Tax=Paenibacillus rubinfantis TaxID=1720296 RepID=UPI00073F6A71|nr:hypothetical protein [Paenibacillus rubinfantis]
MKPRMKMKHRLCLIGVLVLVLGLSSFALYAESGSAAASLPDSRPTLLPASLRDKLRQGGYVIYVRHGEANVGQDRPGMRPEDCTAQRNLSAVGRGQARRFGSPGSF